MTTTWTRPSPQQRRRLDVASLALFVLGLVCGTVCYWLIADHGVNALWLVPSVVIATTGASHLTKLEAKRDLPPR